jgi:hypothetical protein
MNPLIHGQLGWLVGQRLRGRRDRALVALAGVAPDLDGLSLLGGLEAYGTYHHVLFHGMPGALLTAGVCAALGRQRGAVAALALLSFHLHVLCDLAGSGPGWPILYLWPLSRTEWLWEGQWDLASWQNTLLGLGVTLAALGGALWTRRTPVELLSPGADARVVATLRHRFLGEALPPGAGGTAGP